MQVGDKIEIIDVAPGAKMEHYIGRTGVITSISKDPWGETCLYGTWGGCSLHLSEDTIKIISEN